MAKHIRYAASCLFWTNEKQILSIFTPVHHDYPSIFMLHSSCTTFQAVVDLSLELNGKTLNVNM